MNSRRKLETETFQIRQARTFWPAEHRKMNRRTMPNGRRDRTLNPQRRPPRQARVQSED